MMENTFGKNIVPANDRERLEALKSYRIADTPSEESFDSIARLSTHIFNVPVALLSLVDEEEVFFKANIGMGNAKTASRGKSLCALAVLDDQVTVFEDALKEPCLLANPNVVGEFGLRFYAGAPLITREGFLIGTLCIIDKKTRVFTEKDKTILRGLAKTAMDQIELRRSSINTIDELTKVNKNLNDTQLELESAVEELAAINDSIEATNAELHTSNEELSRSYEMTVTLNSHLQASEMRLKSFITSAPVGFGIFSGKNFTVEVANERLLNIWEKDSSILGKPLIEVVSEDEIINKILLFKNIYETGETFVRTGVKVTVNKDGEMLDEIFDIIYEPLKDESGKVTTIIVIANNVTDQIMRKAELEDLNRQLKIALEAGQLGTFNLDTVTGKMLSSEQLRKDFGVGADENFDYLDFVEKIVPEFKEMVQQKVSESIENKTLYQAEYQIRWPDNSLHWINASGLPSYNEFGETINMIGVTLEVTKRKNYETQKDDFLNIASHELKTPITSLKTSIQLLKRLKDKPGHEMIPRLIDNSSLSMNKLEMLVNDLLNINRVSEGNLELDKEYFRVADMLNLCCNHIREEGNYNLIVQGDTETEVFADRQRIDQVIVNFVNNAVKYAPHSPDIFLIIKDKKDSVEISVRDFGEGIDPALQPFLFDRYYRADNAGKTYSGLGLGLYISAEIIRKHNGEVGVESTPGEGSRFWFTLPAN